jgi:hypothetical protein
MKIMFGILFAVLFSFPVFQPAQCYGGEQALNADDVIKNVDPSVVSKAQFKEYFRDVEGKKVKGQGLVVNVLGGGLSRYRISILTPASEPEKGYNVVLYTSQDAGDELKKGDKVSFEGEITRVNPYRGASLDIHGTYKRAE